MGDRNFPKSGDVNSEKIKSSIFKTLAIKITILIVTLTLGNRATLMLIGYLNRVIGRPIKSVFVCYAAHQKYADRYIFSWTLKYYVDNPMPIGIYCQNRRIGLAFFLYTTEDHFHRNKAYLLLIRDKTEVIRQTMGADSSCFAGTLPSEMHRSSLMKSIHFLERCQIVADVVLDAEKRLQVYEQHPKDSPIILLGGKGSIGKALKDLFAEHRRTVYVVDANEEFPSTIINQPAILIDVSRKGVLETRLPTLWKGLVVLNEVFPEPNIGVVNYLRDRGIPVYHVVGVRGWALPSFPYGYAGGIPCCAAIQDNNPVSIIRKLG